MDTYKKRLFTSFYAESVTIVGYEMRLICLFFA